MPKEKQDAGVNVTEILNIQILQDTIKNLEESKLKLLLTIKELKEQLAQQKEDQADIYYYLNKKCDESFEVIASLEEQLLNEQSDREIAERQYETKIDELKTNYLNMESKLTAKIGELETKLEMVNKYGESKDEMERTLHELMNKLEEERQQFRTNIESIENKYLLEREKLRKSYEIKYENMKKELEASIDGKISKKTQRTQIMNVVIRKELDTQSKHADRLLEINDDIVERDKQLKIDLELASSLQQELTRKLHANEKITKKFKDDYDQINEEMKQQRQQCDEQLKQKNEEIENLQKTIQQLSRRQEKRNKNMDDMWDFLSHNYQHLIKYSKLYSDKSTSSLPAQKDQTLNKSASVTSQYSNNPFSPPKSIAKQHEEILKELIKNLAIKYPDEVKQYLNFGKQIAERTAKRNNKSGIPSWDNQAQSSLSSYHSQYEDNNYDDSNDEGGGAVKVKHQMVQTEELLALFPSDSVWNNASSAALPRINQSAYSPRSTRGGGSGESIQITMVHSPIPPTYYGATSPTAGGAPSVSSATVSTGRGSRKGGQLAGSGSHPNTAESNRHSQPQQPPQRSTYTRPFKFIDINKWDSSQSIFSQDSSVSVLSKHPTTTKYQQQSMLTNDLQSLASSMSLSYQGSSVAGVHSLPTYILGTSLQAGGGGGGGGNKGGIYPLSGSLDSMSQVYPHTVTGGPTMTKEKKSAPSSKHRSLRHPNNNNIQGDALATQSMTSADGRGLGSFYDDATISLLSHTPDLSVTARTVKRSNNEEDDVSAILQEDYQEHDYDDSMASSSMPTPLKPVNYYELTQQQRQPSLQQIDSESQSDEIIESDREREESVVLDLPSVHAVANDSHSVDSASIAMSLASTTNNSNHVIPPPNPNKRSLPPSPMIKASVNVIGGSSSSLQSAGSSQTKGQPQSNLVINSRVKYTVDPHYRGSAGGTRGNSSGNLSVSNNSSVVSLGITPNSSTPIVSQLLMSPLTSHLPPPSHPSTAGDNTVNTTGLTLHSTSSTSSHLKDSVDALEMSIAGKKFVLASQK